MAPMAAEELPRLPGQGFDAVRVHYKKQRDMRHTHHRPQLYLHPMRTPGKAIDRRLLAFDTWEPRIFRQVKHRAFPEPQVTPASVDVAPLLNRLDRAGVLRLLTGRYFRGKAPVKEHNVIVPAVHLQHRNGHGGHAALGVLKRVPRNLYHCCEAVRVVTRHTVRHVTPIRKPYNIDAPRVHGILRHQFLHQAQQKARVIHLRPID